MKLLYFVGGRKSVSSPYDDVGLLSTRAQCGMPFITDPLVETRGYPLSPRILPKVCLHTICFEPVSFQVWNMNLCAVLWCSTLLKNFLASDCLHGRLNFLWRTKRLPAHFSGLIFESQCKAWCNSDESDRPFVPSLSLISFIWVQPLQSCDLRPGLEIPEANLMDSDILSCRETLEPQQFEIGETLSKCYSWQCHNTRFQEHNGLFESLILTSNP